MGFTTRPGEGRSGPHASDVAKVTGCPVIHVNADDPEAVDAAAVIATEWRMLFKKDIVIDVVGYRRHGHNERDDPTTTLPVTYNIIKRHPTVIQLYENKLKVTYIFSINL